MCVKRAIDENISIKQSELDYVDSEINRKNAVGNFIPNINIRNKSTDYLIGKTLEGGGTDFDIALLIKHLMPKI